eukprot:2434532-Prymnesium_polylepis.1
MVGRNCTAAEVPLIDVSQAFAVQVYRLILDEQERAVREQSALQRRRRSWADVHCILASLRFGQRVERDAAAAKRLQSLLARRKIEKEEPIQIPILRRQGGLAVQVRHQVDHRGKSSEIKHTTTKVRQQHASSSNWIFSRSTLTSDPRPPAEARWRRPP